MTRTHLVASAVNLFRLATSSAFIWRVECDAFTGEAALHAVPQQLTLAFGSEEAAAEIALRRWEKQR